MGRPLHCLRGKYFESYENVWLSMKNFKNNIYIQSFGTDFIDPRSFNIRNLCSML